MARHKEFEPDLVLQRALELFWERGYEATSVADLVEHLGISRASIYATFGDKHELYVRALHRYLETRDPDPIEVLSQPGPALPAVRKLIELYLAESTGEQRRRGCMVVNAAAEMAPTDAQVARFIESSWSGLEAAISSALFRARAQGELADDSDPRALARFLVVFIQGIRVVGKGSPDAQRLRDAATQALSMLD